MATIDHIVGAGTIGEPLPMAAALRLIEPDWRSVEGRLNPVRRWLYREI